MTTKGHAAFQLCRPETVPIYGSAPRLLREVKQLLGFPTLRAQDPDLSYKYHHTGAIEFIHIPI